MDYEDFVILRGGVPHIRDTKTAVADVVSMQQQGASPEDILETFSELRESDLRTARIYYISHENEVEAEIVSRGLRKAS